MDHEGRRDMATRFEQLEAWQIADELRREIIALTSAGRAASDFAFRDEIRDAASSAVRNIAEGFGRFRPKEFARFLEYSVASVMEARDLITDGIERQYFTLGTTERARSLAQRSRQVSRGLMRYLKTCREDEFPFGPPGRTFSKQASGSRIAKNAAVRRHKRIDRGSRKQ
jgi:four helix bundle protein